MYPHKENSGKRRVQRVSRRSGFTLVELLLVLMILAALAAIVLPKLSGRSEQAKETAAQTQISSFDVALDAFEVDNGFYPQTLDDLLVMPSNADNWRGPYLKKSTLPMDPWGNDYIFEYPGKFNENGCDIMSVGPDGRKGGDDDITNYDV